jgi:hypothetical protein
MAWTRWDLIGLGGVLVASLLGHALFFGFMLAGMPCLNTLHPGGPPLLCHVGRFAFYLVPASVTAWVWMVLSERRRPSQGSTSFTIAAVTWVYWYVFDPSLLLLDVSGTAFGRWWMEYTYGRPILGELYHGWGFAGWWLWLALGQGVVTMTAVGILSRVSR